MYMYTHIYQESNKIKEATNPEGDEVMHPSISKMFAKRSNRVVPEDLWIAPWSWSEMSQIVLMCIVVL